MIKGNNSEKDNCSTNYSIKLLIVIGILAICKSIVLAIIWYLYFFNY